jgi:hypothetical protein
VPASPYLCGLCVRGEPPRPRFSVSVTPPIGRTHNEQVCFAFTAFQAPLCQAALREGACESARRLL